MIGRTFLALTVNLLALAIPCSAQIQPWDVRVIKTSGDVLVYPADGSPEIVGAEGFPLIAGDRISVSKAGSAEIAFDANGIVNLRENTQLVIDRNERGDVGLSLNSGTILTKLVALAGGVFKVKTQAAIVAVRGTEFGVEVDETSTHVGVFDEGKVEVSGHAGRPEILISNQETSVVAGREPSHAVQLGRLIRHRAFMRGQGRRLSSIKAKWKLIDAKARQEQRSSMIVRLREAHGKMLKERQRQGEKIDGVRKQQDEARRKKHAENVRKMEERRRKIRERIGKGAE